MRFQKLVPILVVFLAAVIIGCATYRVEYETDHSYDSAGVVLSTQHLVKKTECSNRTVFGVLGTNCPTVSKEARGLAAAEAISARAERDRAKAKLDRAAAEALSVAAASGDLDKLKAVSEAITGVVIGNTASPERGVSAAAIGSNARGNADARMSATEHFRSGNP